jgi:spore coat polysaccharide biosynthesis protein SpsF
MNIVILCARQSSTRLPGKALVDILGYPILRHIIERYQFSKRVHKVIVATSEKKSDDGIEKWAKWMEVPCYRGDLDNVVKRMNNALLAYAPEAEYVYRGLGDMPLFDVDLLDWRFDLLRRHNSDVIWTGLQDDPLPVYGSRESPWSRRAWDIIAKESVGDELEHAGEFLYRHLRRFHVTYTEGLMDEYYRPYRLELDTADDLAFFRTLFQQLYTGPGTPRTLDALRWLDAHPDVAALNCDVETKTLTRINWKQRGVVWACTECGARPLRTGVIKRRKLETMCPRCGHIRIFKPVEDIVAESRA